MTKCLTSPDRKPDQPAEPLLPAVVILPDRLYVGDMLTESRRLMLDNLHKLYVAFAQRFECAYYLTVPGGLYPMGDDMQMSSVKLEDMDVMANHYWLLKVEKDLQAIRQANPRLVCLCSGLALKALRRLDMPMSFPMAGMSEPTRRRWLTRRIEESNFAVGLAISGQGLSPLSPLAPPAAQPATAGV